MGTWKNDTKFMYLFSHPKRYLFSLELLILMNTLELHLISFIMLIELGHVCLMLVLSVYSLLTILDSKVINYNLYN